MRHLNVSYSVICIHSSHDWSSPLDVILSGMLIHYAITKHKFEVYDRYHVIPAYAMTAYIFQVSGLGGRQGRERGEEEERTRS